MQSSARPSRVSRPRKEASPAAPVGASACSPHHCGTRPTRVVLHMGAPTTAPAEAPEYSPRLNSAHTSHVSCPMGSPNYSPRGRAQCSPSLNSAHPSLPSRSSHGEPEVQPQWAHSHAVAASLLHTPRTFRAPWGAPATAPRRGEPACSRRIASARASCVSRPMGSLNNGHGGGARMQSPPRFKTSLTRFVPHRGGAPATAPAGASACSNRLTSARTSRASCTIGRPERARPRAAPASTRNTAHTTRAPLGRARMQPSHEFDTPFARCVRLKLQPQWARPHAAPASTRHTPHALCAPLGAPTTTPKGAPACSLRLAPARPSHVSCPSGRVCMQSPRPPPHAPRALCRGDALCATRSCMRMGHSRTNTLGMRLRTRAGFSENATPISQRCILIFNGPSRIKSKNSQKFPGRKPPDTFAQN